MLTRRLGRTEHHSSVAILGGAAFARCKPEEAEAGWSTALDAGVNHLDIAPTYGRAQTLLGPLLPAHRRRLFVACKTARHHPGGVLAQLEESLTTLGCEQFDLYQLHGVTDITELDRRNAAIEVILAARDQGLCRFVGITGHNLATPTAQAEALRRWDLDTVMFPVSPRLWSEPNYRRDAEILLERCRERDVGVMAIKAASARPWGHRPRTATTWYEPYTHPEQVASGVGFALSTPGVHAFCTPGDLGVMATSLRAAEDFVDLGVAERQTIMAKVAGEELIFPMATA